VIALIGVLVPNHGGPQAKPGAPSLTATEPGETSPLLDVYPDAATERARTKAVATVRPLAAQFLTALVRRSDLALARSCWSRHCGLTACRFRRCPGRR
jgi:hypothetical protein